MENRIYKDVKYADFSERNILDIYIPEAEEFDVVVYFHGGGLEVGSKENTILIAQGLQKRGVAVVSPNYRLYPDAKFPEFLEDAAAAVAWVKENISDYGKAKRIFIGGSSAGAYITAMLAYNPLFLAKYNIKTSDIAGYIINSSQMTTHFNVLRERGLNTSRIIVDEAAPVYYLDDGMYHPNVLILVADNDMPCRYEQNMMFVRTLKVFGCTEDKLDAAVMKNATHCSYDGSEEYHDILYNFITR